MDKNVAPGWYKHDDHSLRRWDGEKWTDDYAPLQVGSDLSLERALIWVLVIAGGILIAWMVLWVAAQAVPEAFYWPVGLDKDSAQIEESLRQFRANEGGSG